MIDYTFFMKNFGYSEAKAREKMSLISDNKFNSVNGISRLNEDTLMQKFQFYKSEFGYSVDEIFRDLKLLTYNTTTIPTEEELSSQKMDPKVKTCIRAKAYYLRNILGLTNEQIKNTTLFSFDTDTLKQRVRDLYENFGLEPKHICDCPTLLYGNIETFKEKAKFYNDQLGYTKKQFRDFPALLNYDCDPNSQKPTSVIQKIKFYKNELGLKDNQLRNFPVLLSYDTASDETKENSVRYKLKVLKDLLGFTKKEFQKHPTILSYDCISDESHPSSIRGKIKFYREFLGFENEDFLADPGIFSYDCTDSDSKTSVKNKIAFYENFLGLTKDQIKKNTILLHFDCDLQSESPTSIVKKLEAIYKIGLTNDDIQANPRLLMTPAEDLESKYILWSTIFPDKQYMDLKTWFITRPEKIYARYKYLTNDLHVKNLRPTHLNHCEGEFKKRFKSNSDILMEKYPLDENAIKELYIKYNQLNIQPPIEIEKSRSLNG